MWSITRDSEFISPPPGVGSGAICLIGPFWLGCCDRASVISPHTGQGVRSLCTFHNGGGKSPVEIWPQPSVFQEASLRRALAAAAAATRRYSVFSKLSPLLCLTVCWKLYRVSVREKSPTVLLMTLPYLSWSAKGYNCSKSGDLHDATDAA